MKILVTGSTGFLGSHFRKFLEAEGHDVRDCYVDLTDVEKALKVTKDMDFVVHFAADMGGVGYFHAHDYYPFLTNMQIDINILKACEANGVKRLLYASSACVYPIYYQQNADVVVTLDEGMLTKPAAPDQMYGWEKLMGLKLCERAPFDARVAILNTIYGPECALSGERVKAPAAIARKCIEAQISGKPIKIWGNGRQIRQFLYISDACEMLYKLLMDEKNPGPTNITATKPLRLIEFYDLVTGVLGFDSEFELEEKQPTGVISRVVSGEKFAKRYKFKPLVDYEEGFARLVTWIKTQ